MSEWRGELAPFGTGCHMLRVGEAAVLLKLHEKAWWIMHAKAVDDTGPFESLDAARREAEQLLVQRDAVKRLGGRP